MIKLIIFDIAGIVINNADIPFFKYLAERSGKTYAEIEEKIAPLLYKAEKNEITEMQFLCEFLKSISLKEGPQEMMKLRRQLTKENEGIRQWIQNLRKKYTVAFATNNTAQEFEDNYTMFHYDTLFDYGVVSYQVGERKTGKRIFEKILTQFHISPEEAVFMDDNALNLRAPKELGMHTIHFISLPQCKTELKKLGVEIDEKKIEIKWAWFDFEGTLAIPSEKYNEEVYKLYAEVCAKPLTEKVKKEFDILIKKYKRKTTVFTSLGKEPNFFVQAIEKRCKPEQRYECMPYTDKVIAFLKSKKISMGIFTSLSKNTLIQVLNSLNLNPTDFNLLTREDIVKQKPAIEGFEKIIQISQVPEDQILFIGDSEIKDILPSKTIGMHTMHIGTSTFAENCVADFKELYEYFVGVFKNKHESKITMNKEELFEKIKQDILTHTFYPQGAECKITYIANPLKSLLDMRSLYGLCYPFCFSYNNKGYTSNAFPKKETIYVAEQFLKKQNPQLWEFINKKHTGADNSVQKYLKNLAKEDLSVLSIKQLIEHYIELGKRGTKRWVPLIFIDLFDINGIKLLEQILQKRHPELITELGILTHPHEFSYVQKEKIDMLQIAKKVHNKQITPAIHKLLQKHQQKYYWYKNNYGHVVWLEEADFLDELQAILNNDNSPEKELQNIEKTFIENCKKRDALLKKLPLKTQEIFVFFQKMADWRDIRKRDNCELDIWLKKIATILAEKLSISKDLMECVVFWDIERLITDKEQYIQELKKRNEYTLFAISEKYGFHIISGDKARELAELIEKKYTQNLHELRGRPACIGEVTGTVHVISKVEDFARFQRGDILVTAMTRPEFVPLMQKAGAVITDEGGLTCHAAIVSRELGVPCIVGTELATRVLKDNMTVKVDARKGIITIIKV